MSQKSDIIIVQKKTTDESHQNTRGILLNSLNNLGYTTKIFTLDDLLEEKISYFNPNSPNSGLLPGKKIVISLGGDGTLLHASHHIGHDIRLLGINASPTKSAGYMCALKPDEIYEKLPPILSNSHIFKSIQRFQINFLKYKKSNNIGSIPIENEDVARRERAPCILARSAYTSDEQHSHIFISDGYNRLLPLCLNDVLICHTHPAATTRVVLSLIHRKTGKAEFSQTIFSSGIWVSTVPGQTAAISSYDFPKGAKEADAIFVVIREPYFPKNTQKYSNTFSFASAEKKLSIVSNMPEGLLCVDGHDICVNFALGDTISFSSPKKGVLKLVL